MKFRKIISVFLIINLAFSLCSCGSKEYHARSEIILIEETTEAIAENTSSTSSAHDKVYYTKTGKRYHYINQCGRGTYYECTLDEAEQKGLSPCNKCVK